VLRDEVAGAGVQAACEEAREDEVRDRAAAPRVPDCCVEEQLDDDGEEVVPRDWDRAHDRRAERVKEDLERSKKGLSEDIVEQEQLKACSCVDAVLSKVLVVDVVFLERSSLRHANGKICEYGEGAVCPETLESEVVVRGAANRVGDEENGCNCMVCASVRAVKSQSPTTNRTTYFVRGVWPISFVTSGRALRVVIRRERWGSSVISRKKNRAGPVVDADALPHRRQA
jgi:hypothetical protein